MHRCKCRTIVNIEVSYSITSHAVEEWNEIERTFQMALNHFLLLLLI